MLSCLSPGACVGPTAEAQGELLVASSGEIARTKAVLKLGEDNRS